jgi:glutamate synthase (NADPH/NADH) small chain
MTAKERLAIARAKMPEADPTIRVSSQQLEVNLGLTPEMARQEARRCLDCARPTCMEGCPVGVDIPGFVKEVERGEFGRAAAVLRRASALPAVCGRVCPQERQCEARCFRAEKLGGESVAIGYLERFAADWELSRGVTAAERAASNGIKVAVVGSGPSGLSCAGDLLKRGFEVTVFEALHEVGGVLRYGIPGFRLPGRVVAAEVDRLRELGARFETNYIAGMTGQLDDLRAEGFRCFYISSGAGLPRFMGIPGENLNGVLSSNEYLTRVNLMGAWDEAAADTPVYRGRQVVVVGGGNTAMDSARTARRLGAERVTIVYRRGEEEMPARAEEVRHAREEGCAFATLSSPVAYAGDERRRVRQVVVQRMELGEADESGRRAPVAVEGSEYAMEAEVVVVAVGVSPNPIIPRSVAGLEVSRRGTIVVDPETMRTNIPDVYAGGDIVRGGATVILAMGDGRRAARHIARQLLGE